MELLGPEAWRHRDELSEVKRRVGITHDKFDCWIYKFLENKHFNIEETVAKLQRRAEMERGMLEYVLDDPMREMMSQGITQIIGTDKEGRVTLYIVPKRDFPKAQLREQRKKNFDMWFSYATRLRRGEPRCRITMLINQKDAGVWANTDMTFQTNIAIRMSKFYPGMFDRAYICLMGGALGAMAKPIIKAMPASISEKVFFYNEKNIFEDKVLLKHFDASVIPTELGGSNDCDNPKNWRDFAKNVEDYFVALQAALARGMSVKEYEQSVVDEEESCSAPVHLSGTNCGRQLALLELAQRVENTEAFLRETIARQHDVYVEEMSRLLLTGQTRLRGYSNDDQLPEHGAAMIKASVFPEDDKRKSNYTGFSLHLFFDIDEDVSSSRQSVTSTIVLTSVPVLLSLLLGLSFMVDSSLGFIIPAIVFTLASALATNVFVRGNYTNVNGNLLRATSWVSSVYWIFMIFAVGFTDAPTFLQGSIIAATLIVAYFVLLCATCYFFSRSKKRHRIAFRSAYASYGLLILVGIILCFIVNWALGLIAIVFFAHGLACYIRPQSITLVGSLLTVLVMLFVGLTLVLYSYQISSYWDTTSTNSAVLRYVPRPQFSHSLCLQSWGTPTTIFATDDPNIMIASDFALFNVFSYHQNVTLIEQELAVLYPSFSLTAIEYPEEAMMVIHVFESNAPAMTVVSIVPGPDREEALQGLGMWMEAIALEPYGLLIPTNWTAAVIETLSGLNGFIPLPYHSMLTQVQSIVAGVAASAANRSAQIFLTGHSSGGGVASVVGAMNHIQTVAFDSPGALMSRYKFGITEWNYLQYVTSVVSSQTSLGTVDDSGASSEVWTCASNLVQCSQVRSAFCALEVMCGTHLNRSYASCGINSSSSIVPPPPPRSPS